MSLAGGDCAWCIDGGGDHLYIVLNDPVGEPPSVILVNITKWTRRKDQTLIIQPNMHPSLTVMSVLNCRDADVVTATDAENYLTTSGQSRPSASEAFLNQIKGGLRTSPFTPLKVIDFLLNFEI